MRAELERAVFDVVRRYASPYGGKAPTKYIAGFQTPDGRHLAVQRAREEIALWLERDPPGHLVSSRRAYAPSDTRSSNLTANAPRVDYGRPAYYVVVPTIGQLEHLMAWYAAGGKAIAGGLT
jgi:hypothetical protein